MSGWTRSPSLRAALFALALTLPQEALVSQVSYEDVPFEQLLRAPVVVRVRLLQPRFTQEEVPVAGAPTFMKVTEHVEVLEVLHQEPPSTVTFDDQPIVEAPVLQPGMHLRVHAAELRSELALHRKYYVEHVSKSPIYQRFPAPVPLADTDERIVFLRFDPWNGVPEFAAYVIGAEVPVSWKSKIKPTSD